MVITGLGSNLYQGFFQMAGCMPTYALCAGALLLAAVQTTGPMC